MKIKVFYHILMINHWESIVLEQLNEMKVSGLYDEADIYIGALGSDIDRLRKILKKYPKCDIVRYSDDKNRYEFWTEQISWHFSQKENFYGLYIHTKGVSWPNHSGGDYWRHYMNHYNVTLWRENVKKLRKGYDTCGVKLLGVDDPPAHTVHYSGNFFWFKSSYLKGLPAPEKCNCKDRFQAEFWIGMNDPDAATLCQDFVDYNTPGVFKKGKVYVHTLCWNLTSEVEKVTKLLYSQDSNFIHVIVDLGFPILPNEQPDTKGVNTKELKRIAAKYGSRYIKLDNIGVSQNWEQVYRTLGLKDEDVLIGADPDEHPQNDGWVTAMANVLKSGYPLVSLMMTNHVPMFANHTRIKAGGENVIKSPAINWALIGMAGWFIRKMGGVPYPKVAERYGWIEMEIRNKLDEFKLDYAVLTDYRVLHTDYELHDEGTSKLLREWKNLIIFQLKKYGQISFEEYLKRKANGEFN